MTLPGTLPDGLRVAGPASYECTNPNGNVTTAGGGTFSATVGTQTIAFSGGIIPANFGGTDGTCVILVPVTAGSSTGALASYAYTLVSRTVTGMDGGGLVENDGDVTQTIGVRAVQRPVISKSFAGAPVVLGGAPVRLSITVSNSNGISLPDVGITDVFPLLGGTPALRVAAVPNAQSACTGAGTPPVFNPVAGAFSVSATGGTVAPGGSCTLAVDVVSKG